jgi:hypothetical protein
MNIDSLKEGFEQIKIKHHRSPAYQATHAALVKDGKVFVGIAKCHGKDQFNKKLGIKISVGRAMHAWKVDSGIELRRGELGATRGSRVIKTSSPEEIETVLMTTIFTEPTPALETPVVSSGGCCGRGCND